MLQQKLLEQTAKQLGNDLTMEYQGYPSAAPMVELVTAGKLASACGATRRRSAALVSSRR
jgi:hypothetical protein